MAAKKLSIADLLAQYGLDAVSGVKQFGRNIVSDAPVAGRHILSDLQALPDMAAAGNRAMLGATQRISDMLPPILQMPSMANYRPSADKAVAAVRGAGSLGNDIVHGTTQRALDALGAPRGEGYDMGDTRLSQALGSAINTGVQALPQQVYQHPLDTTYNLAKMFPSEALGLAAKGVGALRGAGRVAQAADIVEAAPAATARAPMAPASQYVDPKTRNIEDWKWRPLEEVQQGLGGLSAVSPEAINFGRFMQEKNLQAQRGMDPRDLLKAYGITRSSIQRQARGLSKAEEGGLKLGHLGLDTIRPEGAFAEWLGTDAGQAYLDAAQRGQVRTDALDDLKKKFRPFGFHNTLAENLGWAAENLPQEAPRMSDLLLSPPGEAGGIADYRAFIRDKVFGVAAPKAGFVGSMLGRGDLPTLDARQILLHTGEPTAAATPYMDRKKGLGGVEGVDRLAGRLSAMNLAIPEDLAPYYQHLAHHTVWDKASDEATTHADLMNAMRNYATGGYVSGVSK